jgi:hypothetical protein
MTEFATKTHISGETRNQEWIGEFEPEFMKINKKKTATTVPYSFRNENYERFEN